MHLVCIGNASSAVLHRALTTLATLALVVVSLASCDGPILAITETQYCNGDGDCDEDQTCEPSVSSPLDKECTKKRPRCGSSCRADRACGELRCNVTERDRNGNPTAGTCVCPAENDKCGC